MIILATILVIEAGARVPLTLAQAVELAHDSSASVRLADSRTAEAQARTSEATSHLLPTVTASAAQMSRSYNFLTGGISFPGLAPRIPFYSIQDVRLGVKGPLIAPAAWMAKSAAELGAKAKGLEREATADDASLRGALGWNALCKAQALEKDREEALKLAHELEGMALDLKASGVGTGLDVLRARTQVVVSERALSQARLAREQAAVALSRELGFGIQDTVVAATALTMDASTGFVSAEDYQPLRVKAADQSRQAAEQEVSASRAKFLPTLGFGADYGLSGQHLADDGEWTGQIGVFAEWELWDGGTDDARLAQAREREHQAAIAAFEARRQSGLDRKDAQQTMERTREQLALATRQASLADSMIAMSRDRFREGASGNLEVVQAQAERNTAHAAWIEAAGAHQATLLRLRWATGHWDGI